MERHPLDIVTLGMGVFLGVLAGLALGGGLDDAASAAWLAPLALALVALVLVVSVLRRHRPPATPTADEAPGRQ